MNGLTHTYSYYLFLLYKSVPFIYRADTEWTIDDKSLEQKSLTKSVNTYLEHDDESQSCS